jgi:hypothetical protein
MTPNNELVYRAMREALDDATTVHDILIDVEAVVESYAQEAGDQCAVREEMRMGQQALGHLTRTFDWLAMDEPQREATVRALTNDEVSA